MKIHNDLYSMQYDISFQLLCGYAWVFLYPKCITLVYNMQTKNSKMIFFKKNVYFLNVPKMGTLATSGTKRRVFQQDISLA